MYFTFPFKICHHLEPLEPIFPGLRLILNISSKMIIFGSPLTTFEVNITFVQVLRKNCQPPCQVKLLQIGDTFGMVILINRQINFAYFHLQH